MDIWIFINCADNALPVHALGREVACPTHEVPTPSILQSESSSRDSHVAYASSLTAMRSEKMLTDSEHKWCYQTHVVSAGLGKRAPEWGSELSCDGSDPDPL
jgi:hypothetical protein